VVGQVGLSGEKDIRDSDIHSRADYRYYSQFILEMNKCEQIFEEKTMLQ